VRLKPSDIAAYYQYKDNKVVGVELYHRPTGVYSGVHTTRDRAEQMLREGIVIMCGDFCGGCPNCQT